MSFLLFIDESGIDRKQMPYEIHGGIIVPMSKAWDLIRSIKDAELRNFGTSLSSLGIELKGETLLKRSVFKHAEGKNKKRPDLPPPSFKDDQDRRRSALAFLTKNAVGETPRSWEFRAYGLACLDLVDEIFQTCVKHDVRIIGAAVDPGALRPPAKDWTEMLRKDLVYLFERLYYFMETQPPGAMAACVFDQKDDLGGSRCTEGQKLNECIARYFTKTHTGRIRSSRILPEPLYARSDLTTLLGVADLAIYTINHIFRPTEEWTGPIREELRPLVDWIYRLQWKGQRENESWVHSIFHMTDLRPKGNEAARDYKIVGGRR